MKKYLLKALSLCRLKWCKVGFPIIMVEAAVRFQYQLSKGEFCDKIMVELRGDT